MRPSTAPPTIATVRPAKISWKTAMRIAGTAPSGVSAPSSDWVSEQARASDGVAEREAVAEQHPEHGGDGEAAQHDDHRVEDVLRAGQAAVVEGEAGHHEGDRDGGGEHPAGVDGRGHVHECSFRGVASG
jgi:hypothetical protein